MEDGRMEDGGMDDGRWEDGRMRRMAEVGGVSGADGGLKDNSKV